MEDRPTLFFEVIQRKGSWISWHAAPASEIANLHVLQALVVGVEHRARLIDLEVVIGANVPRDLGEPIEVRADPAVLRRLVRGALQPPELTVGLLANLIGHPGGLDLGAKIGDHVVAVIVAELLADGGHLLAQDQLALALLEVVGDLVADPLLDLDLGERVLGPRQHLLEALLDVDGLEDLDLPLEAEIGRVAGHVGDLSGVVDPTQELRDLGNAARLDDRLDDRPVLPRERTRASARLGLVDGVDLDPRGGPGSGNADTDHAAVQPPDHGSVYATPDLAELLDLRDGSHPGVAAVDPRNEHQLTASGRVYRSGRVGRLDRKRHDHAGKDDPGRQRKQRKGFGV